ncbi:hypothetical protein N0B51_02100 [Tsuneonella sp. YG55]|uniref:Uncharacterized protein n=1 Tax=Tsuneonella litorea TaxID=2976475 RepID=A0A9X2VZ26_9SPHN|nr:hypothetical protein [Tsuneonella litorea]MCT2557767.1 hypothetical protein [Tsuneonella litorea]
MFEAVLLPATVTSGEALRPLDWGELAARFSAARDLRALVVRPSGAGSSFGARAGAGLPHDALRGGQDEPTVNLEGLEGMKPLGAITAATMQNVAEGDQGTQ